MAEDKKSNHSPKSVSTISAAAADFATRASKLVGSLKYHLMLFKT